MVRPHYMLVLVVCLAAAGEEPPRFNRDVRPILSDKCFPCHGPDSAKRKAGLRLDAFEGALAGNAIVPGDPAASTALARIHHPDPGERMPPADSGMALSREEIDTLTRWIASGAAYEAHWSFVPLPDSVPVPEVSDNWVREPLDAFVLERLHAEGLSPSPEAKRETWLRRVYFDLTGLPPSPADIAALAADTAPGAYERAVDRLLESPAFGERMAVDWLDAARYADTFGYQADVDMEMWPWRDWVISAFNRNLPYADFLTWQIAGDLLPNATQEQRLATGFNRLHRQTNEGGSINEEFRQAYIADRTETFATATMGLTFNCARCHDHKFDPISQREYFSLAAFFANIDESGLYSHFTRTSPTPALLLYEGRQEERHAMLKHKVERLREALDAACTETSAEAPEPRDPQPVLWLPFDSVEANGTPDAAALPRQATFIAAPTLAPGHTGQAMAFTGDDGVQVEGAAAFERCDPFSIAMWIKVEQHIPKAVVAHRSKAESDAASRGYEILLDEGRPVFSLIHFWPGNAIRLRCREAIPEGVWVHLAARYDGSSRAAGAAIFINGVQAGVEVVRDNLYKTILYENDPRVPFTVAQRFRDNGLKGGALDDLRVYDVALSAIEIAALAQERSTAEQWKAASPEERREHVASRIAAPEARAALHQARRAEAKFVEKVRTVMVMEEMPEPKPTFVLTRGEYDMPAEQVQPGTPEALPPFPKDAPRNRLGLARWLTDPRHPLTARVAVNRYWQLFFGRGLVETQEDFGNQGRPPTHTELLDYLAREFVDSGWDLKALCRRIVLSATYRQDSAATPELLERDPANTLLARGPRFRMSAEQIRDAALAASGLLHPQVGGPSVKPYQPAGLWEDAASAEYVMDKAPLLYRRGLYTYIKRTVPLPSLVTFDGTAREVCTVRRERTATPLQALVLLNDPQFVEAARVLAERSFGRDNAPTPAEQIDFICQALLGRRATGAERDILIAAMEEQHTRFAASPEDALRYAEVGEAPRNEALDPAAVAAATAIAQAVMNLDEFQVRR